MSQMVDTGTKTFTATEAIPKYSTVKLDTGGVGVCDLTDRCIGTAVTEAYASGDLVTVKLLNAPGTHKVIANEASAANATLYTEAGGLVQDTAQATSLPTFLALEAATAQFDVIEALALPYGGPAAE